MNRWERFCIVGYGNHARTKLVPAIAANGQQVAAVVSRQSPAGFHDMPVYATLGMALAALPRDTAIVIATPPMLHHAQAAAAIDAGFDAIVEKPAFVTAAEARDIDRRCAETGAVVVEAFMHRHTALYRHLLDTWRTSRQGVVALEIEFLIPELPADTFRAESAPGSSTLYDIGCYIVALLGDLGLPLAGLDVSAVEAAGTPNEAVTLTGELDGIGVTARIGVGHQYRNVVTWRLGDGTRTTLAPFFYGRQASKRILHDAGEVILDDVNAFEALFAVPREQWRASQRERLAGMLATTARLEELEAQVERFRRAAA